MPTLASYRKNFCKSKVWTNNLLKLTENSRDENSNDISRALIRCYFRQISFIVGRQKSPDTIFK